MAVGRTSRRMVETSAALGTEDQVVLKLIEGGQSD